jgi:ApbE superfamily uncharacterized protein (UPF0280 family)
VNSWDKGDIMNIFKSEFHWKQTHMKLKCDLAATFGNAKSAVMNSRLLLEAYISTHPDFVTSIEPLEVDLTAPEFMRRMMHAAITADVGPMAAVAGGLSEVATEAMVAEGCKFCLAENGGDISIKGNRPTTIGVYAGENELGNKIGFKIKPDELPMGVCTSAGTVGHSISLGDADAVIIFSSDGFLSDAAATAVGNYVKTTDPEGAIQGALEKAESIEGIKGCMILCCGLVGITGRIPDTVEVLDSDL